MSVGKIKITRAILLIILLGIISHAYGYSPQNEFVGDTQVEMGTSTKDLMPVLIGIAERQGRNFEKIYGQYRAGYILIIMKSRGNNNTAEEIGERVIHTIENIFPLAEGRVELVAGPSDTWNFITLYFDKGEITKSSIMPDREVIRQRVTMRNKDKNIRFGLTIEQRKQFCHDQGKIIDSALDKAEAKYGEDVLSSVEADVFQQYYRMLYQEGEKRLLERYGVNKEQAEEIYKEGDKKGWFGQ